MESVNWHNSCSGMLTVGRASEQDLLGNQESIEFLAQEIEGKGGGGTGSN